jgi:phenylacetate-CoA ligase
VKRVANRHPASSGWPASAADSHLPPASQRHWEPTLETMDPEERLAIVDAKLRAQVRYAYDHSLFYQEKWDAAGVRPEDIRGVADLRRLPLLHKEELRAEQAAHPPFGRYLCVRREDVARIHGTSGTTGRPTAFAISRSDWQRIATSQARIMWSAGIRPHDTVFLGSFFGLYMGGWGALIGTERLGATAFPFGAGVSGHTQQAVQWLLEMHPTAFYGTPSYALRIAEVAHDSGIDPREFGLRILFFSGEPGAGIPSTKRLIEETFGGICIDTGSMAEMTPWMTNAECEHRQGMHMWEDIVYTELLDPETEEPVRPGEIGVPVYTHLERESQPMIRLWSGDLSRHTTEPCPCGRTYARLPEGLIGRADDMLIVRGENVYPSAIEEAIRSAGCHGEFRVIVTRKGSLDELTVRVECDPEDDDVQLRRTVATRLKTKIGVRAEVEVVKAGSLERTEFKSRRVEDRRDIARQMAAVRGDKHEGQPGASEKEAV